MKYIIFIVIILAIYYINAFMRLKRKASQEKAKANKRSPVTLKLFEAVEKNDITAIKKLLKEGASLDAPNEEGMYPLHIAARNGSKDVLEALLKAQASIDSVNWIDLYLPGVISYAAENGNMECINLLLSAGASIDQGRGLKRPIVVAANQDNLELVELLVKKGAWLMLILQHVKHGRCYDYLKEHNATEGRSAY